MTAANQGKELGVQSKEPGVVEKKGVPPEEFVIEQTAPNGTAHYYQVRWHRRSLIGYLEVHTNPPLHLP